STPKSPARQQSSTTASVKIKFPSFRLPLSVLGKIALAQLLQCGLIASVRIAAAAGELNFLKSKAIFQQQIEQVLRRPAKDAIYAVGRIPVPCHPEIARPSLQHFFLQVTVQVIPEDL